jgi:predicted amidohydrolase
MRVAPCQLPISPERAINLDRVAEAVATAARQGADLAVFPEATQARFGSDLRAVAEPLDGAFGAGLADMARGAVFMKKLAALRTGRDRIRALPRMRRRWSLRLRV